MGCDTVLMSRPTFEPALGADRSGTALTLEGEHALARGAIEIVYGCQQ